ncbi:uncharacterized protein LOC126834884 [Adelges cooleyi]|uniref:uncharacterized protein LOC126834884 n=1 Tax=Adelges cooleyi TaxID=133065 RepID=UPI00217F7D28|nr:uncharacterized protein LOC126834884 [Adelges cooleyi]
MVKNGKDESEFSVDHTDLIKYYEPQLKHIIRDYKSDNNGKIVLDFTGFKNAINDGHLLVSLGGDISAPPALRTIFNRMIPEKDGDTITHKDLMAYYEPQIKSVIKNNYGEQIYKEGAYRLYFHQYRKIILEELLPLKFYSK